MIYLKTYIRNRIGILDGMGLYEIEIDWTRFQPGVIGVFGDNGCGKTSLIEGMIPYRSSVSRSDADPLKGITTEYTNFGGELYDEYFVSSYCPECQHREVGWAQTCEKCGAENQMQDGIQENVFMLNGERYRSVINVDSLNRRMTAYLYKGDDEKPLNDKLAQYDQAIEDLLLPFPIYRKTVFVGQREESIGDFTKKKLRDFFARLCDVDYFEQKLRPFVKEKHRDIDKAISDRRSKLEELERLAKRLPETELNIQRLKKEAGRISASIKYEETERQKLTTSIASLSEIVDNNRLLSDRMSAIIAEGKKLEAQADVFKSEIDQKILRRKNQIANIKDRITGLDDRIHDIQEKLAQSEAEQSELNKLLINQSRASELRDQLADARQKLNAYDNNRQRVESLKAERDQYIQNKQERIKSLQRERSQLNSKENLTEKVPCNESLHSNCPLFVEKVISPEKTAEIDRKIQLIVEEVLPEKFDQIDKLSKVTEETNIEDIRKTISDLESQIAQIKIPNPAAFAIIQERLKNLNNELADLQATQSRVGEIQAQIVGYESEFTDLEKEREAKLNTIHAEQENLRTEYRSCRDQIDNNVNDLLLSEKTRLKQCESRHRDFEIEQARNAAQTEAEQKNLEYLKSIDEQMQLIYKAIAEELQKISGLQSIDRFLTEYPVIEMEVTAPRVTEGVNQLLGEFYEGGWYITLKTVEPKKTGTGYKEVFSLEVSRNGNSKKFNKLSGGQMPMLEHAIRLVILSDNHKKSGSHIRTVFLDENDAFLSDSNAMKYIGMAEHTFRNLGLQFMVIVSHKEVVKKQVEQFLLIKEGGPEYHL